MKNCKFLTVLIALLCICLFCSCQTDDYENLSKEEKVEYVKNELDNLSRLYNLDTQIDETKLRKNIDKVSIHRMRDAMKSIASINGTYTLEKVEDDNGRYVFVQQVMTGLAGGVDENEKKTYSTSGSTWYNGLKINCMCEVTWLERTPGVISNQEITGSAQFDNSSFGSFNRSELSVSVREGRLIISGGLILTVAYESIQVKASASGYCNSQSGEVTWTANKLDD